MAIEVATSSTASHSGGYKAYLMGNGYLRALTLEPRPLPLSSALGWASFHLRVTVAVVGTRNRVQQGLLGIEVLKSHNTVSGQGKSSRIPKEKVKSWVGWFARTVMAKHH